MSKLWCSRTFAMLSLAALTCGCAPKMTLDEMKAQMPKRPPELDLLNPMVGKWEGSGEAKFAMMDETLKMTGKSEARWAGDGWYMVEEGVMTMDGFDPMKGMGTWSYDTNARKFRSTWVDSMGMTGIGEATRGDDGVWHWKAKSHGPWGESRVEGTMRFVDNDTVEWKMTEYMGLMKTMEMTGTNRRVQ